MQMRFVRQVLVLAVCLLSELAILPAACAGAPAGAALCLLRSGVKAALLSALPLGVTYSSELRLRRMFVATDDEA